MTDKKTVNQIVNEYKKRRESPDFDLLVFPGGFVYHNVTNFVRIGHKLDCEFDSTWKGKTKHIKTTGYPTIEEKFVEKAPHSLRLLIKSCETVKVRKGSGREETYEDVTDLRVGTNDENKDVVEFDTDEGHTMTLGDVGEYTGGEL